MSRSIASAALLAACTTLLTGCTDLPTAPSNNAAFSQTDIVVGTGADATNGRLITVHYTGWLYDADAAEQKGAQFDSSAGREPLVFTLGSGQVIGGWDVGIPGMKAGGIRRLVIPPSLGYGNVRNGPIPPNASLVFDVELLEVQ